MWLKMHFHPHFILFTKQKSMEFPKKKSQKPHVLLLPFPLQGHTNPMLQFAKRLVAKGVDTSLATTVFAYKSMHTDSATQISVHTISDGFDERRPTPAESSKGETFRKVGSQTLAELIEKLASLGRPVNAIVYDGVLPWALDVAKRCGVLGAVFFTQSCAVNSVYYSVNRGLLKLPLLEPKVSTPGLPLLDISEVPSFVSTHYGSHSGAFDMVVNQQFSNVDEADWVLVNTFYELETKGVEWMAKLWELGTIGPAIPSMFLDKRLEGDRDYGINLFKPNSLEYMNWLNQKPKDSVVYVSFGSLSTLTKEQMEEVAWGLKGSNCYFLWVVRATEEAKLPENFTEELVGKGLLVQWCSQLEVLEHDSVGCFLTHCGFNSVLEALSLGMPVVGMPQWADQPTNAKYVEDIWKTGIRARPDENQIVKRDVIELCIKEVMGGEKGKEIKENAIKWRDLARAAVDEGGSSDKNIDEFVTKLAKI